MENVKAGFSPYDPVWNVSGGRHGTGRPGRRMDSEQLLESFRRLARRAVLALGQRSEDPAEAADFWLSRVHTFHTGRASRRYAIEHWRLNCVLEASAEYCAETATRSELDGDAAGEQTWAKLECLFRKSRHPGADLSAIRRRDTGLQRDRYPLSRWLYDHSHEALADRNAELDYWKAHIWKGFHMWIEHCAGLQRRGRAWTERHERLKFAIDGLSYDLAVLHSNHAIEQGLRGDDAMRAFRDEAEGLLKEATASWRTSCKRLAIRFNAKEVKVLAVPFQRVEKDLQRLLNELPSASSTKPQAQSDGLAVNFNEKTEQRKAVDAYIDQVFRRKRERITRTDIWRVAG